MKMIPRKQEEQKLLANHPTLLVSSYEEKLRYNYIQGYMLEIHLRAQAMTPVLKEILDYRPSPHWNR